MSFDFTDVWGNLGSTGDYSSSAVDIYVQCGKHICSVVYIKMCTVPIVTWMIKVTSSVVHICA